MYKAFIEPDLKAAQLKIHNSFNPFTGFMNATYILKAPRDESLTQQRVVEVLGVRDGPASQTARQIDSGVLRLPWVSAVRSVADDDFAAMGYLTYASLCAVQQQQRQQTTC